MNFRTVFEAVAYYSKHTPDKICLIDTDNNKSITYNKFWSSIHAFSIVLINSGVKKGDHIVVRVGSPIETIIAHFSINLAGAVYCPVEKQMKEPKLAEMLDYFDATALISTECFSITDKWFDLNKVLVTVEEDSANIDTVFPNANELSAIIFTTGTTGKAKGVMISYGALAVFSDTRKEVLKLSDTDNMLWTSPLDRVGGMRASFIAFFAGCTASYCDGVIFLNDFFNSIKKFNITALYLNSFTAVIILRNASDRFKEFSKQLKVVSFGGGFMPEKYKKLTKQVLPKTRLIIFYGSAEVSTISYFEYREITGQINCVGTPHLCTKVSFVEDRTYKTIQTSKEVFGIVACESTCSMVGYWKDVELTEKTIIDGRIIMTDVGYFGDDGLMYLMGRRDDVIVSGGHKIAPYEVEDVVLHMQSIAECVCIPANDEMLGAIPKLFVVINNGFEFSAKEIFEHLSNRLETYKVPRIIRELDSLPRVGTSQKIDRKELLKYE